MSQLSEQECTAGISRRALETFRSNGRKPPARDAKLAPRAPEPGSVAEHLAAGKKYRIESPEKTAVIDRWDRALDLLNLDGWNFRIRDTHHYRSVEVDQIALDRVELEMLGRRIAEVLATVPAE